eukprot:TRINITY_DN20929_c0_g1_i1.p1 TRINITY_DN20929_c0_g1~~TRINITY_DN20929_c0_g1_i1.p1  ORF type:complete len:783 (+),score=165.80 TRINITY_DN20929_c0_g1_i1:74-2350(+)
MPAATGSSAVPPFTSSTLVHCTPPPRLAAAGNDSINSAQNYTLTPEAQTVDAPTPPCAGIQPKQSLNQAAPLAGTMSQLSVSNYSLSALSEATRSHDLQLTPDTAMVPVDPMEQTMPLPVFQPTPSGGLVPPPAAIRRHRPTAGIPPSITMTRYDPAVQEDAVAREVKSFTTTQHAVSHVCAPRPVRIVSVPKEKPAAVTGKKKGRSHKTHSHAVPHHLRPLQRSDTLKCASPHASDEAKHHSRSYRRYHTAGYQVPQSALEIEVKEEDKVKTRWNPHIFSVLHNEATNKNLRTDVIGTKIDFEKSRYLRNSKAPEGKGLFSPGGTAFVSENQRTLRIAALQTGEAPEPRPNRVDRHLWDRLARSEKSGEESVPKCTSPGRTAKAEAAVAHKHASHVGWYSSFAHYGRGMLQKEEALAAKVRSRTADARPAPSTARVNGSIFDRLHNTRIRSSKARSATQEAPGSRQRIADRYTATRARSPRAWHADYVWSPPRRRTDGAEEPAVETPPAPKPKQTKSGASGKQSAPKSTDDDTPPPPPPAEEPHVDEVVMMDTVTQSRLQEDVAVGPDAPLSQRDSHATQTQLEQPTGTQDAGTQATAMSPYFLTSTYGAGTTTTQTDGAEEEGDAWDGSPPLTPVTLSEKMAEGGESRTFDEPRILDETGIPNSAREAYDVSIGRNGGRVLLKEGTRVHSSGKNLVPKGGCMRSRLSNQSLKKKYSTSPTRFSVSPSRNTRSPVRAQPSASPPMRWSGRSPMRFAM